MNGCNLDEGIASAGHIGFDRRDAMGDVSQIRNIELHKGLIEDHQGVWQVRVVCDALSVSPSGYYARRSRPDSPRKIANRAVRFALPRRSAGAGRRCGAGAPYLARADHRAGGSGSGDPAAHSRTESRGSRLSKAAPGERRTLRWREPDSNHRSRVRKSSRCQVPAIRPGSVEH